MTNTTTGAEEPDKRPEPYVISSVNANFTVSSDGHITISYPINAFGSMTPVVLTEAVSRPGVTWRPVIKTASDDSLLFDAWVARTKEMQEGFFGQKFEDFTQEDLEQWVRTNVLAAEDELHEALGEISWKPWASAKYFNREAYLGEIVDVLHFVGNLLAGAGITDEELNAAYLEKMQRNRQRQTKGYTGVDKCAGCKRAVDDIIAHGGTVAAVDGQSICEECE